MDQIVSSSFTKALFDPTSSFFSSLLGCSLQELEQSFLEKKLPRYRATQIMEWLYQKRVFSWEKMSNLPQALRNELSAHYSLRLPEVVMVTGSRDTTQKFLLRLEDGALIEMVLIAASPALYGERSDRRTLCVSSQVGCAYGCRFCASGLDGWKRHLKVEEIVAQILLAEQQSGKRVDNLVFMGMGEPLANIKNLLTAIEILNAPWGVGLAARKMTISTSGLVPQIRSLAECPRQVRLAISLHGASDPVRSEIMPINRRYPIAELMEACRYYTNKKKQYLTFEYILIAGVNDSLEEASLLAERTRGLRAKVNLIPYNKVEGLPWERPSESVQEAFLKKLRQRGVVATIRREKGHDIEAACGQLRRRVTQENEQDNVMSTENLEGASE